MRVISRWLSGEDRLLNIVVTASLVVGALNIYSIIGAKYNGSDFPPMADSSAMHVLPQLKYPTLTMYEEVEQIVITNSEYATVVSPSERGFQKRSTATTHAVVPLTRMPKTTTVSTETSIITSLPQNLVNTALDSIADTTTVIDAAVPVL